MPEGRPSIPAARHAERLAFARDAVARHGLDAMLVAVGPDLRYLTGYEALPLERLTMLVIGGAGHAAIVVPRLEAPAARAGVRVDVPILTWDETADPYELVVELAEEHRGGGGRVAVSDRLWASHLLRLQALLPNVQMEPASLLLRELRMIKDPDEIALLRTAAHAADRVVEAIATGPLVGRTEADVAREVRERLVEEGHETAVFAIVASGPNSASPHHEASDRVIGPGEPIVLDIGGTLSGYGSDITRTFWVCGSDDTLGPDEEFRQIYGIVHSAQQAATAAVRPGIAAEDVDAVARRIISDRGYAERFIHRTGHGIGLEGHEDPYLVEGNREPLGQGAAFSIEPGIYLDGRYGVRLEDIVVCGHDGAEVLNEVSRELRLVSG